MNELQVKVIYKGKEYTFDAGSKAFIFDAGVLNDIDGKYGIDALLEYVGLVYRCYMKDSNDTPLGKLCDYIAKKWKTVKDLDNYVLLDNFYGFGDC